MPAAAADIAATSAAMRIPPPRSAEVTSQTPPSYADRVVVDRTQRDRQRVDHYAEYEHHILRTRPGRAARRLARLGANVASRSEHPNPQGDLQDEDREVGWWKRRAAQPLRREYRPGQHENADS